MSVTRVRYFTLDLHVVLSSAGAVLAVCPGDGSAPASAASDAEIIAAFAAAGRSAPAGIAFDGAVVKKTDSAGNITGPASNYDVALAMYAEIEAAQNAHSPVEVNFNVLVNADSSVSVFGDEFTAPTNVVVASYNLPVNALYDSVDTKGLLEMWEPADAQGDIKVKLASVDSSASGGADLTGAYEVTLKKLAKGLQRILCDNLDCSAAAPFADSKYAGIVEYQTQRDFGRLALGALAHYFFGHVDATAAITNDVAFVENMLSVTTGGDDETSGGADTRYAAWNGDVSGNASTWSTAASSSNANLAIRLAHAVYSKGVSGGSLVESSVAANDAASLANIVRQVIGQDAQRTKNVDGSERTINAHQLVRFYPGDVIYVNIKVKAPTVTVGLGQGGVSSTSLLSNYTTEQNYAIKITLGARDASL